MIFNPYRPINKICSLLLIFTFFIWFTKDLALPHELNAQTSAKKYLQDGEKFWDELEYDKAISALNKALQFGLKNKDDLIKAHELLARCLAIKQQTEKAQHHFFEVLKLNPNFSISKTESPNYQKPFQKAKAKFDKLDLSPPVIELKQIKSVVEGTSVIVEAAIKDKSGVASAKLYYRTSGEMAYRVQEMQKTKDGTFKLQLRPNVILPPSMEYYIEAIDNLNNGPATKGTNTNPLILTVNPIDKASPAISNLTTKKKITEGTPVIIKVKVVDESGVLSVKLFVRKLGGNSYNVHNMVEDKNNIYQVSLESALVKFPGVEYYIEAIDTKNNPPALMGTQTNPITLNIKQSDKIPPKIEITKLMSALEGSPITINAKITDISGIARANIYFRIQGGSAYQNLKMKKIQGTQYQAEIGANLVKPPAIEYYLEAADLMNNIATIGTNLNPIVTVIELSDRQPPTIEHTPVTSAEENQSIEITAKIMDISGVKDAKVFYRNSRESSYSALVMTTSAPDKYAAVIPASNVKKPGIEYFLSAYDVLNNGPTLKGSENAPIHISIAYSDKTSPVISHQPFTKIQKGESLIISADVTDESGISKVSLFYRIKGTLKYRKIEKLEKNWRGKYNYKIPEYLTKEPGIEYCLQAYDNAGNGPSMKGTPSNPIFVDVYTPDIIPPKISHSPVKKIKAGQTLTISASINDNIKVKSAEMRYRFKNENFYKYLELEVNGQGIYTTQIVTNPKKSDELSYYLIAYDEAGNRTNWKTQNTPYTLPIKKSRKTLLWLSLGTLVVGGTALAFLMNDKTNNGKNPIEADLPAPPVFPIN